MTNLGDLNGPVLVFGGPYSNFQATQTVLKQARDKGIPAANVICTGDVVAYCADPQANVKAIRNAGIHVVMGNCEESLGQDKEDCGCGFEEGSACDLLSVQWFAYAQSVLDADAKAWMAGLPRQLIFTLRGRRFAVIHGGGEQIERFIFPSTPPDEKMAEIDALGVDGVIGGHSGLPFIEELGQRLWLNAGVVGMPANDGTPRTWYAVLGPNDDGIEISLHPLEYDHEPAAGKMKAEGLPEGYRKTLETGLWPNMDILPPAERARQGLALKAETLYWS